MRLTDDERLELWGMRDSLRKADPAYSVTEFVHAIDDLLASGDPLHLYRALAGIERIKSAFQYIHNYGHTTAMLAAKAFLQEDIPEIAWENVEFAGHPNRKGADLEIDDVGVVAELKTTEPCVRSRRPTFGPQQRINIEKDLNKLSADRYKGFRKYMFVTSPLAFQCLLREYRSKFPSICFVLLSGKPTISGPVDAF